MSVAYISGNRYERYPRKRCTDHAECHDGPGRFLVATEESLVICILAGESGYDEQGEEISDKCTKCDGWAGQVFLFLPSDHFFNGDKAVPSRLEGVDDFSESVI